MIVTPGLPEGVEVLIGDFPRVDTCTDPLGCHCFCHVTLDTHIPVCRECRSPLAGNPERPGVGFCRTPKCPNDNMTTLPSEWYWAPADTFFGEDLPPANGYPRIDVALPLTPTVVI